MKKNVGVILLVALFGSLLLNVCQFVGVGHTEKASPWVGTYICGDEWDGATYLVLTAEKEFIGINSSKCWRKMPILWMRMGRSPYRKTTGQSSSTQVSGCGMSRMGRRRRMRRCLTRLCLSM